MQPEIFAKLQMEPARSRTIPKGGHRKAKKRLEIQIIFGAWEMEGRERGQC